MTSPNERRDAPADLMPCPFCGFTEPQTDNSDLAGCSWVHCDGCGANGASARDAADAITAWNRRATPPAAAPAGEVQPVAWMCGDEVYRSQDEIPFGKLPPVNALVPLYAAPPSAVVEQAADALEGLMELERRDRFMPIGREWDAARAALASLRSLQQKEQTR